MKGDETCTTELRYTSQQVVSAQTLWQADFDLHDIVRKRNEQRIANMIMDAFKTEMNETIIAVRTMQSPWQMYDVLLRGYSKALDVLEATITKDMHTVWRTEGDDT